MGALAAELEHAGVTPPTHIATSGTVQEHHVFDGQVVLIRDRQGVVLGSRGALWQGRREEAGGPIRHWAATMQYAAFLCDTCNAALYKLSTGRWGWKDNRMHSSLGR